MSTHRKHTAHLPAAVVEQIGAALAHAAGLDPRSLDPNHLCWTVESRRRALGLADATAYAAHLDAEASELSQLIEAVVVPETRFFRDPAVFEHLRRWLLQLAADNPGPLRVLSAPCSTGQEAYTLAATFALAGISLSRVTIDAFDISASALDIARQGQYPDSALSRLTLEQQQACGTLLGGHWTMYEDLRRSVRFDRRNLAQPNALQAESAEPYHLILCRNLFIYLHPQARATLAGSLAQSLAPGGRLILGSADRVEQISALFSPLKPAEGFAFTHRASAPAAVAVVAHRSGHRPKQPHSQDKPQPTARASAPEPSLSTAEGLYRRALDHRQHGELRRAERRCRQALYLDPRFLPALELLEQLWSQQPNLRLRRALEARIQRHRSEGEGITSRKNTMEPA